MGNIEGQKDKHTNDGRINNSTNDKLKKTNAENAKGNQVTRTESILIL